LGYNFHRQQEGYRNRARQLSQGNDLWRGPFMTRVIATAFFYAALAVLLAPAISVAANDGEALPIYPHTNKGGTAREPTNEKAVTEAVSHGDYARLYTTDSPQTVDHWYREKLPKSCERSALSETNIQYTCATRAVTIGPGEGQTHVILGPKP
jgi:hypothetical protein